MQGMSNDIPALPCWLNGQMGTLQDTKVSVLDRGFIFGDGVYEVVPAYEGRPFRFEEHMNRLDRSLGELRIPNPMDRSAWRKLIDQLVAAYAQHVGKQPQVTNQLVYLQVTRGVAMRDHVMPPDLEPTVFAMVNRLYIYTSEERAQGAKCVTADDFRWEKAHIKSTSLAGAVLSRQMSADVGAIETIMFRDGWLSEAASSNVWVVRNGVVLGPPKDNLVLEGIRYGLLEELCGKGRHPLRAAAGQPGGSPGCRRDHPVLGHQGSAALHGAGRAASWKRPTRSHLRKALCWVPAGQTRLLDVRFHLSVQVRHRFRPGIADRISVPLPHQGDGCEGGRLSCTPSRRSRASSTPASMPRRSSCATAPRAITWASPSPSRRRAASSWTTCTARSPRIRW
jgi:D-alanine transaminase